jgi:hypothetical protein
MTQPPREAIVSARLFDPSGPLWLRAILPTLAGLSFALTFATLGLDLDLPAVWLFPLGGLMTALSRFFPLPFGWRKVQLAVTPGQVEVRSAGLLSRTLRARGVRAVSTAASPSGVLVSVQGRGGQGVQPLALEIKSSDEAELVCDALGIGQHGLGALRWRSGDTSHERAEVAAAVMLALSSLALLLPLRNFSPALSPLAWLAMVASLLGVVLTLPFRGTQPHLALTPEAIDLRAASGDWASVPYGCVEEVELVGQDIVLTLTAPHPKITVNFKSGLFGFRATGREELEHIALQVRSACQRARGLGPAAPEAASFVENLKRGQESPRDWLSRLDAVARSLSMGGAYRSEPFTTEDLWTTLENHDADSELRAAAARVLMRVRPEEAAPRVASVMATLRDEGACRRLRVVTDDDLDLEEASGMLERLEKGHFLGRGL